MQSLQLTGSQLFNQIGLNSPMQRALLGGAAGYLLAELMQPAASYYMGQDGQSFAKPWGVTTSAAVQQKLKIPVTNVPWFIYPATGAVIAATLF